MTINPLFTAPVLGMTTQSYALQTIGVNIANVNSGGYKRTDTLFQTVLSDRLFQNQDLGGVRPKDYQRIDVQGTVLASDNDLDLAINGSGFFIVSPTLDANEQFYTRDGTFRIKVDNQTYTTDNTGQSSAQTASNEGYLVDKNGYYLLGWAPDDTGAFPSAGSTLQPLRVDYNYFANTFETTTEASIGLNLPANNSIILGSQVDTLTIAGTVEAGDVYSVTVNGTTVTYTVTGLEADIAAVRSAIKDAINNNATVGAIVNAAINSDGNIDLVSATAGTAFTATTSATNNGVTADNTAAVSTTTDNFDHAAAVAQFVAGNRPDGFETYTFSVVDTGGNRQTVRLNFTKSDTNEWQVSATIEQDPVAQVDTVTLAGTIEAGETYTVTVNGNNFNYTTTGAEADIDEVRDELIDLINASSAVNSAVTATAGGTGEIVITADTAGTGFTSNASVTPVTEVAQVDRVTLAGSVEAGDTYSVTVNGTTVTYVVTGLEANLNAIRDNLVAAINANGTVGALVTAAPGGAGQLTLTSDTAGDAFTATVAFTDAGGTPDNSIARVTITANVSDTADNDADAVTTTANGLPTTTTAATTLTFTENGVLDPATNLTYSLSFDNGETADFTVDITRVTQFANDFLPLFSESNGFEKSFLVSMQWDTAGHLIGNFGNENDRKLYKVPLAQFVNPNGLQMMNGMVFAESELSGEASVVAADETGQATFAPNAREVSNVRLEDEFARMIVTQAAYNASAMTFKTVDEMTMVARDLKA